MRSIHAGVSFAEEPNFPAQSPKVEQFCFQRIVDIRRVIRNFIDPIDELSFQRGLQIEKIFPKLREFFLRIIPRVFDDAFADFKSEIESGKIKIALFELFDDAKRVQVMIEVTAMFAHQFVQLAFPRMTERRMADVVDQRQRFGQFRVQTQSGSYGPRNLRDFQRVRQPVAEMIGIARRENLCLSFEAAKRARVNDAVAVPRINAAIGMRRLRIAAATGILCTRGPGS